MGTQKSERLKVLFCTDGIFPHAVGGMQRHSRLLVEALARTGEVELIVIHPHPGEQVFEGFDHITEIALPPLPGKKYYLFELKDYSAKVLEIAQQYPDYLIYSQGLSVWKGIRKIADRVIVNPHGLEPYQVLGMKDKVKTWLFRRTFDHVFRRAGRVVSLGGRLTGILQARMGARADRIRVLPNATNPPQLAGAAEPKQFRKPIEFFFVGRFAWNKGIGVLLESVKRLNTAGFTDKFRVKLGGKGPLFEEMKEKYAFPNVKFMGFISDEQLQESYLKGHVFVLPTLFEGMPTVVLEAMSFGMPVIVTDVGATLELVSPENGIIIKKNDVESLVNAIQAFINMSDEKYQQLSSASLQKFNEKFTWEQVAREHLSLFREVNESLKQKETVVSA